MTRPIFNPWNNRFGDQWAGINLMLNYARHHFDTIPLLHSTGDLNRLHKEILAELSYSYSIELTSLPATHHLSGFDVWATDYFPTKVRWKPSVAHRYCCYQFDGDSAALEKNPSSGDLMILLVWLQQCGFEAVGLGKHLSVAQCVEIASESAFFVGVDSGMSHLAHSVGVPMFLLQHQLPIVTSHRGKAYIHCDGVHDLLRNKFPTWVDYLRFTGHPDGAQSTVVVGREAREAQPDRWWLPK